LKKLHINDPKFAQFKFTLNYHEYIHLKLLLHRYRYFHSYHRSLRLNNQQYFLNFLIHYHHQILCFPRIIAFEANWYLNLQITYE